ncbi:DNA polymerase III subunit gamma and tau [Aeromicrobium chenweiae]|uniref:DNA polymerase III subunit gamma/tau n=1 Tax=Aeromicrobium chenweiae TaxID=2079793 RepID=A0A2S0WI12_9ACTN|nr:DNA polymerase III subunit gamma and tau [Aeromicrobium chenweiae]AWB90963.1 DNA polymerase III subunit gamma/tau [Aeromicrobium chenweiae]TGN32184.1 DNA polymerase III subunit gamma and tau [Aeromicrobium chenweiae]
MDAPLALYRRYRPETFAEVIGQEHVTGPLRHALAANKVNHAYLFSGPRGCGKTTSARILARALNCEKAPIADPCGECQSCRDLARGGPGSIDVIEIDAASHGGVDDARDLRERAFFAPVSSRYKVYIIDEAHMVSPQGFNALLKLVEEPPPHLKFIFATTEPDKVIGTIRSRTHHYPFRLVPPKALGDYLMQLCEAEGVALAPTALPLVVRAGQGSVRDTLSVLDQLLGGAGPDGVTYDLAVQLLGYTPDSLLDEAIDAFAASDGSTVFGVVDKVIETGQDPRRFAEDLLQRLRDLVIVAAVPDALDKGLLDVPGDRAERLITQSNGFGPSELTRAADIVNAALMEFRGATAPRLLLELMCARILVPGADNSTQGFQARLDRVERRLSMDGGAPAPAAAHPAAAPATAAPTPVTAPPAATQPAAPAPAPTPAAPTPAAPTPVAPAPPAAPVEASRPPVARPVEAEPAPAAPPVAQQPAPVAEPQPQPVAAAPVAAQPEEAPAGTLTIADVRRLWPEILDRIRDMRRFAWIMLSQNAQVMGLDGQVLTIALVNAGARDSFINSGSAEYVQKALHQVLGVTWRIEAIVDPGTRPGVVDDYDDGSSRPAPAPSSAPSTPPVAVPDSVRQAMREQHSPQTREDPDASADRNDPVVDHEILDPELLLSRELGAKVIDEHAD